MEVDTKKVMILLQRRYNAVRELDRLTTELEDVVARNDGISAAMILQMRGDEMEKAEHCMEEIWQLGEGSREAYVQLQLLVSSDLQKAVGNTDEEKKIFEIRRKTEDVLVRLRRTDQRLNKRLTGEKSYYMSLEPARP